MNENFLHFLSKTPCMLSINGENVGEVDNKNSNELDVITKTNHIYITYTPISEKQQVLPYTAQINTSTTPTTNNENIKIIPFPNNHFDIIMSPYYCYQIKESKVLFNGTIGKYFVSIVCDSMTKIIIYSGVTIIFSLNILPITDVKVEEQKGIIIIEGVVDEKTFYLLAIDTTSFKVLYNDIVHSIEKNQNEINAYKCINTLCSHAVVCNLNFSTKQSQNYHVFENENYNYNISTILIPQAFLECVKIGDETTAKRFLSPSFPNATINQFQDYFGNIQEIYPNRHIDNLHKINYTVKTKNLRNFNFILDNNLIIDIEEIF